MYGSNGGASLSKVVFKDGATKKFGWNAAPNGGGFVVEKTRPWTLAPGTPLKIQQTAAVEMEVSAQYELGIVG